MARTADSLHEASVHARREIERSSRMSQKASAPDPTEPSSGNQRCSNDNCGLDDLRCDVRAAERGLAASARELLGCDRLHLVQHGF